jgi:hypothetical protein
MAKVQVEYCGMPGEGKTLTAAKQDAARKAEDALKGDYTPTLLCVGDQMGLLFRTPQGWFGERITGYKSGLIYGSSYGLDQQAARIRFSYNLAQLAWTPEFISRYFGGSDDDFIKYAIGEGKDKESRQSASELRSWIKWQRGYRELRARGISENGAHNIVSGNEHLASQEDRELLVGWAEGESANG